MAFFRSVAYPSLHNIGSIPRGMRPHHILMQTTGVCFAFLLIFTLGANGQETNSSIPSSSSTRPPSSTISSSTSGVSLGVTGTSTGTADFPTLSGYSDCVTNCFALAVASTDCSSLTAPQCYCNSTNVEGFKQNIISCLTDNCPQELLTGEQLAQRFCYVGPSATSISFPPPPSSLSSMFSSSSPPLSSPSPSSTLATPTATRTSTSNGASSWRRSTWEKDGSTVVFGILIGLGSILVWTVSAA
ncbi:hypothetical protein BJ322DRAFT_881712 [Thelephora terrestris]|uniref:CFEM domain-containing protein n=1 Tax=Thelephora terrestris TaxID=56493 RepID=A0A9P6HBU5_9AGAM|nr:hypothetical protein BJ322DRAFT_881712 [Thelephora terrestris]